MEGASSLFRMDGSRAGAGTDPASDPGREPDDRARPIGLNVVQSLLSRAERGPRWTEAERHAVMAELLPDRSGLRPYLWRFASLSVLSTVLASLGLIANSVATVIAGMLIDPLMTPVLGSAAALVHGQPRRVLRSLAILTGGTGLAIATGWLVAAASPAFTSVNDLAPELLLRTSPSLLDLGVAVAAGVSAGYVLTHREASSVIPGVAVAVALVPPLAAVGVLLNVGATTQAQGAMVLYLTNLGAIILAAVTMLIVSGFAPRDRRRDSRLPVRAGLLFTSVVLILMALPMARQTFRVIEERTFRRQVSAAVNEWDPTGTSVEVTTSLEGRRGEVTVVVSTLQPVSAARLAALVRDRAGRPVHVEVEYRRHTTDAASAE